MLNRMVEHAAPRLDGVFHALADPTRRAMIRRLSRGEHSVSELAEPFAMTLAAVSKHLKVLEGAGIVSRRVQGRTRYCRLEADPLAEAHGWLAGYQRFWHGRLDVLEALLKAEDEAAGSTPAARREEGHP